jgi:hypothetical protein
LKQQASVVCNDEKAAFRVPFAKDAMSTGAIGGVPEIIIAVSILSSANSLTSLTQ